MHEPATALLGHLDNLATAAARSTLSGGERLARLTVLDEAVTDVAGAAALDPYRDGRNSIISDTIAVARARRHSSDPDPAAIDRLNRHHLARTLTAAVAPQRLSDTPGLVSPTPGGVTVPDLPTTTPLLALASRFEPHGLTVELPHYGALPSAVIDPVEKSELATLGLDLGIAAADVHSAAYGVNVAMQVESWAVDGMARIRSVIGIVVDRGLEGVLLADLLAAAGTAFAGLDAAEAAVATATGLAADIIAVNPVDVAKVRAHYAPIPVPLRVLATAGLTAGTGLVMASPAMWLLATDLQWMEATEPRLLGKAVVGFRDGAAAPLLAGAIAAATIT